MLESVRIRLTLWYAGVLALSLIAFAIVTYFAASHAFYARQDESLRSTAEMVASAYLQELEESNTAEQAGAEILKQTIFTNRFVALLSDDSRTLAASNNLAGKALTVTPQLLKEAKQKGFSYGVQDHFADGDDEGLRTVVVRVSRSTNDQKGFVIAAESLGLVDNDLERLRNEFMLSVPVILLLASIGGFFLARKTLAPIALMNRQTRRITAESLTARLDVTNERDELGSLAVTINDLLARLDTAFQEQQRFMADASHELRTPVAILRGETEIALERERTVAEYRDSLKLIGEEAERLTRIVTDIFTLAGNVPSSPTLFKERLYINDIVADCVRAAEILSASKSQKVVCSSLPEITIEGDEQLLKQMLLNLLDNAVKYTPSGGDIFVNLKAVDDMAIISVRDTGIGIPLVDQPHIFERFYRVDKARSRELGGAGLGLAIARWIAESHHGEIKVESSTGQGSTFSVTLPLKAEASRDGRTQKEKTNGEMRADEV